MPLARNVKHGTGSAQTKQFLPKVTDDSCDLGCDQGSIRQPRQPYQTGALTSAGGAIYEGVAYCTMWQFLILGASGKTLKF